MAMPPNPGVLAWGAAAGLGDLQEAAQPSWSGRLH